MKGQWLQVVDKLTYLRSTLSRVVHINDEVNTLEAYCLELCTSMTKSVPGLPKLVQHLANYVEVYGIKVKSDLTQSWKSTDLLCCQNYYTHVKLEQFTKDMPKDWCTPIQAVLETSKISVSLSFRTWSKNEMIFIVSLN